MSRKYWGVTVRALITMMFALLCASGLMPAAAGASDGRSVSCVAYGDAAVPIERQLRSISKWDCSATQATIISDRVLKRIPIGDLASAPAFLVTKRTSFERLHLSIVEDDGQFRTVSIDADMLTPSRNAELILADLPAIQENSRYVIAAFDQPTSHKLVSEARLEAHDPTVPEAGNLRELWIAGLCGMMLMPLAFDFAFHRVLRQNFIIWHAALTLSLLVHILVRSGLANRLFDLHLGAFTATIILSFGAAVASAAMFARSFIEPDKLHPLARRLLMIAALWSIIVALSKVLAPLAFRTGANELYYLAYLPVLLIITVTLVDALLRGSRAAKFQLCGWAPFILVGFTRIASYSLSSANGIDALAMLFFGALIEILATTWGVADRFMVIRRERDRAMAEAKVMEALSEKDPLTGLSNRRGVETRFRTLRERGYRSFALLDIDRFKSINDTYGHETGDRVLQAIGKTIGGKQDVMAVRIGGEEFVLLLRGRYPFELAENLRRSITARIAAEVSSLDRPVTASMGMVELPLTGMDDLGFEDLYRRADKLLYEAKDAGRNRSMFERLTVEPAGRRASDRQATA